VLDHRGVIGVDQARLGVQILDRLIVGVGVGSVVVDADIGQERVNRHRHTSIPPAVSIGTLPPARRTRDHS